MAFNPNTKLREIIKEVDARLQHELQGYEALRNEVHQLASAIHDVLEQQKDLERHINRQIQTQLQALKARAKELKLKLSGRNKTIKEIVAKVAELSEIIARERTYVEHLSDEIHSLKGGRLSEALALLNNSKQQKRSRKSEKDLREAERVAQIVLDELVKLHEMKLQKETLEITLGLEQDHIDEFATKLIQYCEHRILPHLREEAKDVQKIKRELRQGR